VNFVELAGDDVVSEYVELDAGGDLSALPDRVAELLTRQHVRFSL
jgi:hypothetical protein